MDREYRDSRGGFEIDRRLQIAVTAEVFCANCVGETAGGVFKLYTRSPVRFLDKHCTYF